MRLQRNGCASDAISDVHPTSEAGVRGSPQFRGSRGLSRQGGREGPRRKESGIRGQESKGISRGKGLGPLRI